MKDYISSALYKSLFLEGISPLEEGGKDFGGN